MSRPGSPTPGSPRRALALAIAALLFVALATANSGGYRYGASDQAFYIPAVAMTADNALFPRDRPLFDPQMRLWLGDSLFAALAGLTGSLPSAFGVAYLLTLLVLFGAVVAFARGLGFDRPAVGALLAIMTLKHQITQTGANSLEGYGHPRMLAFAAGLLALACLLRQQRLAVFGLLVAAALVHITTALWFGVAILAAWLWEARRQRAVLAVTGGIIAAGAAAAAVVLSDRLVVMEPDWLAAIGDRSYLFAADWPVAVWTVNLGYVAVIAALHHRRRGRGASVQYEAGLVVGAVALSAVFLVTLPATAAHLALAVQLQANRVFWVLDVVAAAYIAWWLLSDAGRGWTPRARWAVVAALVLASAVRGGYLLAVAPARPMVTVDLPHSHWTEAMRWLRTQPADWHVLADPQHAVRFGSGVRVAALRDTLLEAGKDPALAIYDRTAAARVLERTRALADFDTFTEADVRALASRYNLDVFVERADRPFDLPILYRNDGFIVYDLR